MSDLDAQILAELVTLTGASAALHEIVREGQKADAEHFARIEEQLDYTNGTVLTHGTWIKAHDEKERLRAERRLQREEDRERVRTWWDFVKDDALKLAATAVIVGGSVWGWLKW